MKKKQNPFSYRIRNHCGSLLCLDPCRRPNRVWAGTIPRQ